MPSEKASSGTSASAHAGQAAFNVNSRMFGNSMRNVSTLLQQLLQDVYKTVYGGQCEFRVTPVAKMEIQTFDDLESAVRSGAVTMDLLANIAHSLSSDFPTPRCVRHISDRPSACTCKCM